MQQQQLWRASEGKAHTPFRFCPLNSFHSLNGGEVRYGVMRAASDLFVWLGGWRGQAVCMCEHVCVITLVYAVALLLPACLAFSAIILWVPPIYALMPRLNQQCVSDVWLGAHTVYLSFLLTCFQPVVQPLVLCLYGSHVRVRCGRKTTACCCAFACCF